MISVSYPINEIVYKWKNQNNSTEWNPIQIDDGVKLSQFDLLGTKWNVKPKVVQKGKPQK